VQRSERLMKLLEFLHTTSLGWRPRRLPRPAARPRGRSSETWTPWAPLAFRCTSSEGIASLAPTLLPAVTLTVDQALALRWRGDRGAAGRTGDRARPLGRRPEAGTGHGGPAPRGPGPATTGASGPRRRGGGQHRRTDQGHCGAAHGGGKWSRGWSRGESPRYGARARRQRRRSNAAIEGGFSLGAPGIVIEGHARLGSLYARTGSWPGAARQFELLSEAIEANRAKLRRDEWKLTYQSSVVPFFDDYVDLLMERGRTEAALEAAESCRGRVLAEKLAGGVGSGRPLTAAALRTRAGASGDVRSPTGWAPAVFSLGADARADNGVHSSAGERDPAAGGSVHKRAGQPGGPDRDAEPRRAAAV